MVDFGPDILDTEVPEVEQLDVDISEEPQHELTMALTSGSVKSSSPVVFDFSLQSRVEVILNAIINDLVYGEHPKSRVEQILLYILGEENELPKPHSRVEELLIDLALELESTDISPKSRVEQILLVLLNQPYEFPITNSRVEELLIQLQTHVSEVTGPLPLTINSDGTALIDYRIYGNTVQTGTPTPENPIMPEGVGERTENLLPSPLAATISNNGITVRSDGAGRYYASGTATNDAHIVFNIPSFLIPNSVGTGGSGTLSIFNTKQYAINAVKLEFYYQETLIDSWSLQVLNRTTTTYSVMSNKTIDAIGIFVKKDYTVNVQLSPEVTNNGVLPANYEPYGYKLPMVSRGENLLIETPIYIGDTKLAKDEYVSYSEQKVYKYNGELTIKGDETNIYYYGIFEGVQTFHIDISNNSKIVSGVQPYLSCNYYPKTSIVRPGVDKTCRYQSPNIGIWDIGRVYFMDNDYTSLSSFKTHLSELYDAGKPLKVEYTLKNAPISIDPPVPLPKIPTFAGTTVIDYDGTPKPSQMYVKYNKS